MFIEVLKSKIHRVTVTQANLNYIGSITIDSKLMEAAGIFPGERVYIVDNNNGERLDTYAIPGEPGSGVICLNGAAARKVQPGDIVIIMSYATMTPDEARTFKPSVIFPDTETNSLTNS
ncbi:MAG: aspartate 1-decarboxylase [Paramuribaculum sp.]|nr:aspartate 1-decarboxylase [Barnesiella sp.]MDE5821488.1 aspartate 1-decarboxylase [Paramuribaculum sp.]MDE5835811.1 aspartate 1-decarboxylase [Paramuribaculum sp.]